MDREPQAPAVQHGGSDLGSRYDVLGRLAVGGMAELFLARPRESAQIVVIKRILPQLAEDPEFVRMFRDEAHLAATLHHPNIARVFDIGLDGDEPFFAMEYVHGENLRTILRGAIAKGEPIPLSLVLTIADGLCAALHHAHEQADGSGRPLRIVHRDVSPTNVLVSQRGEVKIVDFGIAKAAAGTHVTQAGMLKGKASYMSPEQCRAEGVDRRSDIFAIGILLFELTTLQRLFKGENELAILHQILTGQITRPSSVTMNYPAELEAILLRTLQIDPSHRYLTAAALRDDLRAFAQRYNLPLASEPLARYIVDRFGAKPYPWSEAPQPTADESSSSVPRAEPAAPANVRPVPRAPTGASAAANKPGAGGLKPAPRPKAASPGIVARKTGPSPAAVRAPVAARPTDARASTGAAPVATKPPESTSVPVEVVDDPSLPTTVATSSAPTASAPTPSAPTPSTSTRSPATRSTSTAPAFMPPGAPTFTPPPSSVAPGSASAGPRPSGPTQPSVTRPSAAPPMASPRPSGPTQPSVTRPSGSPQGAAPRPSGPTQPSPARPLAMTMPPPARPPTGSRTVVPDPSPSSAADSAAFLRGEPPPGAEFTAGAPEVRSGGTQIAIPMDGGPVPTPVDPGVLGGTITLPGVPSSVDRTVIAMEPAAPIDRTRIAGPDSNVPIDPPRMPPTDPTVMLPGTPPLARPPVTDPTVMLPGQPPLARPPAPVDRTMIASPDLQPPSAPPAWPTPMGSTQPVAIDPGASSLAPAVAPRRGSGGTIVVVIVAVVLLGALGAGGVLAYPRVRAWIAARNDAPSEPDPAPSESDEPATPAGDDAAEAEVEPPPETKVEPPPETKIEPPPETPPDTKVEPPPDTKVEPPPDTKVEPPPDTKVEPPPDTKVEPPPDTKVEPPPDTKVEPKKTTKKKKKKGKTTRDPTVPDFKPGPFVPP